MIHYCKNNNEIRYIKVNPADTDRVEDFHLMDLMSIIESSNGKLNIDDIYYIIDMMAMVFAYIDEDCRKNQFKKLKSMYCEMLHEFTNLHDDAFISCRVGYDNDEPNEFVRNANKELLVEKCLALQESGFVDVSTLFGLEFSKIFVYKNEVSNKFLEVASRYDTLSFIGDNFNIKDNIFDKMSE